MLGDLFEFWMEYRETIPKDGFRVVAALRALALSGVEVHLFAGNHDFNLGTFFDSIGIRTHADPLEIELQGKRLLLLHGDGIACSDGRYRAVKAVLRNPACNWLWKAIHPDLGMKIARLVGRESRLRGDEILEPTPEYDAAADAFLATGKYDAVVHGHTHLAFVREREKGIYVNSGEWIFEPSWVEMENGEFRVGRLEP